MTKNARWYLRIIPGIMLIFIAAVSGLPQNLISTPARLALMGLFIGVSAVALIKSLKPADGP